MNHARSDAGNFVKRKSPPAGRSVLLRNLWLAVASFAIAQLICRLFGISGDGLFAYGLSRWPVVSYYGFAAAIYITLLLLIRSRHGGNGQRGRKHP